MRPVPAWIVSFFALQPAVADAAPEPAPPAPALACAAGPAGLARQAETLAGLASRSRAVCELPDGYAIEFGDDTAAGAVLDFVLAERRCCPFFTFELLLAPEMGPVTLRVRGSQEAKQFVQELLQAP